MATEQQNVGLGALQQLLARNIKDIADLPEFKCPPNGTYKLIIQSCGYKAINDKPALEVRYTVVDILALQDINTPEEEKVIPGAEFSEAYFFDKQDKVETTLSVLKLKYGALGATVGTNQLDQILEKMVGLQVQAIVTGRKDKNDSTKKYPQTKDMVAVV